MIKQYLNPIYTKPRFKRYRWLKVFVTFGVIFGILFYFFIYKKNDDSSTNREISDKKIINEITETKITNDKVKEKIDKNTLKNIEILISNAEYNKALILIKPFVKNGSDRAIKLFGDININLLKSYDTNPNKLWYVVKSGDALWKIAKKYNTTISLSKTLNNRKTDTIRVGERLLVFNGRNQNSDNSFKLIVSKENNTLDLILNNQLFKRYSVGTGKFGKTPVTTFIIYDKIIEPPWTRPSDNQKIEYGDPENVLGTRWMALKSPKNPELTGFGIHGTWERDSIGSQSSDGCIRMFNEQVEELFDILPRNTVVTVIE